MKITTTKEQLAPVIARVAKAVPSKPVDPGQSAIRMIPHFNIDGTTTMVASAFDGDTGIKGYFSVEVVGEMEEMRPSGLAFADIVKDLPDGEIVIELKDGNLWIQAKRSKYRIPQLADLGASWSIPALPPKTGSLSGIVFTDGLSKVVSSASKNLSLPTLNAVKFEINNSSLRMVATDRYRLTLVDLGINTDLNASNSMLVPTKVANELVKSFGKSDEVTLYISDSLGGISDGKVEMVFRVVAGEFPKYNSIVEVEPKFTVNVESQDFKDALKRVNKFNPEFVRLEFSSGKLTLSNANSEDGEGYEDIDTSGEIENLSVSFNPNYIGDAYSSLEGESNINFSDSGKAIIIKSPNSPGMLSLVMPVAK